MTLNREELTMTVQDRLMPRPKHIPAGEGRSFTTGFDRITFALSGEDTQDALTVGLVVAQPGGGPPPHVHQREDEVFIVLDGELDVWTPDGAFTAGAGDIVFLPAGIAHAYRTVGPRPARFYVLANPSGFERFYEEFVEVISAPGAPDAARVVATGEKYGIEFLPPAQ